MMTVPYDPYAVDAQPVQPVQPSLWRLLEEESEAHRKARQEEALAAQYAAAVVGTTGAIAGASRTAGAEACTSTTGAERVRASGSRGLASQINSSVKVGGSRAQATEEGKLNSHRVGNADTVQSGRIALAGHPGAFQAAILIA